MGAQTALAQIIALVRRAQASRAPLERLADRVAALFVPAIVLLAVGTFLVWWLLGDDAVQAMLRMVAVLVIACPCAMGLATPTAVLVGTARAASGGILFASAEALEAVGRLTTVMLDKTGTLTAGRPSVTDVLPVPAGERVAEPLAGADLLRLAATVAARLGAPARRGGGGGCGPTRARARRARRLRRKGMLPFTYRGSHRNLSLAAHSLLFEDIPFMRYSSYTVT